MKILTGVFTLGLALGGYSFYFLLARHQSLHDLSRSLPNLPNARLFDSLWKHVVLICFSYSVLAVTCIIIFLLALRILSALKSLHRIIDNQVGQRFCEVSGPPRIDDEIREFERDLNVVARKLQDYGQLCLDASPLTRLPGNIAIERVLMERMRNNEKFALCYADLDNFKFFNDRYGFTIGSEVLKMTGAVVRDAQRLVGNEDDFVGHIGGDDFVIITSPERVAAVCEKIIDDFDREIINYYTPEDRARGQLTGKDRYGVERSFPIMTISIAVVSDAYRDVKSPTEIAKIAAEIKEFVKQLPGSNYLVDRRIRPYPQE